MFVPVQGFRGALATELSGGQADDSDDAEEVVAACHRMITPGMVGLRNLGDAPYHIHPCIHASLLIQLVVINHF